MQLLTKIQEHLDLEYLYQEATEAKSEPAGLLSSSSGLTVDSLKVMPSEWLKAFRQAATELDENKLEELIRQIPQDHSSLSEPLQDLVNNLQFETIIKLM